MFGKKLQLMFKRQGWTQKQIADKLSVSQQTISAWVNAAYPPLDAIESICTLFDVPMWQFFAPEDLVIPGLDPAEARYMRAFKEAPTNIKAMMIESNTLMYEAYLEGKKENKVLQKML